MRGTTARALVIGTAACLAAVSFSSAHAQAQSQRTPRNWNYEVDQRGNRVPRGNRITKPDGSWREETRQGNCVTVKERSATGEYRETRQCNPGSTG
jgi:hypothetical protein